MTLFSEGGKPRPMDVHVRPPASLSLSLHPAAAPANGPASSHIMEYRICEQNTSINTRLIPSNSDVKVRHAMYSISQ